MPQTIQPIPVPAKVQRELDAIGVRHEFPATRHLVSVGGKPSPEQKEPPF